MFRITISEPSGVPELAWPGLVWSKAPTAFIAGIPPFVCCAPSYHGGVRTVTIRKFSSFEEAARAEREEYRAMTPQQRLELIAQLRAFLHGPDDATAPRLERVLRITELERR
jgi:hypothetical protein